MSAPVDTSKSLAELTGIDWGPPPVEARELVKERHVLRRKAIRALTDLEVFRILSMGADYEIMIPVSLERLRKDPEAIALLCSILNAETFDWPSHRDLVFEVRDMVFYTLNQLAQITDDRERAVKESVVYRAWALFQENLEDIGTH